MSRKKSQRPATIEGVAPRLVVAGIQSTWSELVGRPEGN
jgi:hypothetical protein